VALVWMGWLQKQHAGDQRRIDAVVAAPRLGVVVKDRLRPRPMASPRDAVTALVAGIRSGAFSLYGPRYTLPVM